MQNQTDEQLVKDYLNGNQLALEQLIQRHLSGIYNFVFKYVHTIAESEDVTQEAFIKIWKNLNKFNRQYKFKTWAYTIAKNTALDHLKQKGVVPLSEIMDELVSPLPLPEKIMGQIQDVQMINHAVGRLPLKYREVVNLYYRDELNFREIAELLKESINTVKTRHRRALMHLKQMLGK